MSQRIVLASELDGQKENVNPLPQGRRAAALSSILKESSTEKRDQEQAHFEKALEKAEEDDDPLAIYDQYIKWIQENFTGSNKELMKVLERGVRTFRRDGRYSNDPRYIRMWMLTAKNTPKPLELFKYLTSNDIGQKTALFYEEYASYLEFSKK
jgi:checkpoint serine/threonine-protein kinase